MSRALTLVIGLFLFPVWQAAAQKPVTQTAPPAISAEQARIALDVLNDPRKRAAFAATLDAIVKGQTAPLTQAPTPQAPTPPAPTPLAPASQPIAPAGPAGEIKPEDQILPLSADSLGAQLLVTASDYVGQVGTQVGEAFQTIQSLPLLWGWAVVMATNPLARNVLAEASWRLLVALLCAIAVEYALRRLMQRPIARLEATAPRGSRDQGPTVGRPDDTADHAESHAGLTETDPARRALEDGQARAEAGESEAAIVSRRRPSAWTLLRRLPLVVARLFLELVPIFGVTITGHILAASSLGGQVTSRLVILAVVNSYAVCTAILAVSRMMLSPGASRLRLFHVPDSAALYMTRWIRRLAIIAVFGYAFGEVGLLLGLSDLSHDALQKSIGLVLHVCLGLIVIQKRHAIRRWMSAPAGQTGTIATARNRLGAVWHWIALFILAGGWLTWAIEARGGYPLVLRYVVLTALVLIGTRLVLLVILGLIDRAVRLEPETTIRYPGLEARLRVYHPVLNAVARTVMYVLCGLGLLQLYGIGALGWFVSTILGQRVLAALGTLVVTILLAIAVWEAVNAAIQSHLGKLQREAQTARSARLRTLLPLLRTTLLVAIAVVAGLMILSEIGVNIAPLLAGAGIIGVAIGFGSQRLVQDLITGIFLLLENAMQVGDTVTVSGLTGTVEALSVRTIRLRAGDGSVHIIPFSAVTSVTNVNRGLGNASASVTVAFNEDTDQVSDVLREIVAEMRAEPDFSAKMLSDLQLWGVDKVDGGGVTLAGQIVCTDSGRWSVQREFNRRMKKRFEELGIQIYNPMRTVAVIPSPLPQAAAAD